MSDIAELREELLAARSMAGDAFARRSADAMVRMFNHGVVDEQRIDTESPSEFVISRPEGALDARSMLRVLDGFTAAVATIGQEITSRGNSGELTRSDYERTTLYPSMPSNGSLVLRSHEGLEIAGARVDTTAERALERIASILPTTDHDAAALGRVAGARPHTARALSKIAEAVKSVGDIRVAFAGSRGEYEGAMNREQARNIVDLVKDTTVRERPFSVVGLVDGLRFLRSQFYIQASNGRKYEGYVDDDVVADLRAAIGEERRARLVEVSRVGVGGRLGRPHYRLVGLDPASDVLS